MEERAGEEVELSGACRTSVSCSTRTSLQREEARQRRAAPPGGRRGAAWDSPGSSWLLFPISPTKELTLCPSK